MSFLLKNRKIGDSEPVYIIAEMSGNHAGSLENALSIVRSAKESGADCIKIQTYTPDTMTINSDKEWFKIGKGTWEGDTLYKLYQKAYTPWEWQARLKEEADKIGIDFLSTPFDKSAVDFLEALGVTCYKIASFEVVDLPLIKYVASKNKPIIMSTGNATLGEIEEAVGAIRAAENNQICLLKCSSAYPAIPEDMNLATIKHLSETFNVIAGLSDHSMGSATAVMSVAMGAKIIEKHFTISRKIKNPDASFSMEPQEFKKMVEDIRIAEKSIGRVSYDISEKEKESLIFRRSLFVVEDIAEGEAFTEKNVRVIRPGYGLKPKYFEEVIGKKALTNIERGTPLSWSMIK